MLGSGGESSGGRVLVDAELDQRLRVALHVEDLADVLVDRLDLRERLVETKRQERYMPVGLSGTSSGGTEPNAARTPKRRNPALERGFGEAAEGIEPSTFLCGGR
jgi:hypothetical protein